MDGRKNNGGARLKCGRKPGVKIKDTVAISIRISPELRDKIVKLSKDRGITLGDAVVEMIKE